MRKRSGQILILVLLIVVVALAVGLSVASRNITNLRTSTQTEQSQRAFSAAEGGVEDVLSRLKDVAPAGVGQNTQTVTVGNLQANVVIATSDTYEPTIDEGNVGQIKLEGFTGSKVRIEWAKTSDSSELSNPASIEVTKINGISLPYSQERTAWKGKDREPNEQGFLSPTCVSSPEYQKCTEISILPGTNPNLLRIRPFWNKATVKVSGVDASLPAQTYNITSTSTTDSGITRKVNVTRTALPQLPASFDYVLFSEQDIVK